MATKPGLGRNLSALLSSASNARDRETVQTDGKLQSTTSELRMVPIEHIQRGRYQPRTQIDDTALQELADSIRSQGIVQPIVLRFGANEKYELIAGERRWRAAQLAGLHEIPALIRDIPDQAVAAVTLIENIQRENLSPLEQALAFQRLVDEFALTHQEVAQAVGRARASVSNFLRLLELDDAVKSMIHAGQLEMGHARALLPLAHLQQRELAKRIVEEGLSVRQTEKLVQALLGKKNHEDIPQENSVSKSPDIRQLEIELSERLGARVSISHNQKKGDGKLTIAYHSLDALDGILHHLKT